MKRHRLLEPKRLVLQKVYGILILLGSLHKVRCLDLMKTHVQTWTQPVQVSGQFVFLHVPFLIYFSCNLSVINHFLWIIWYRSQGHIYNTSCFTHNYQLLTVIIYKKLNSDHFWKSCFTFKNLGFSSLLQQIHKQQLHVQIWVCLLIAGRVQHFLESIWNLDRWPRWISSSSDSSCF